MSLHALCQVTQELVREHAFIKEYDFKFKFGLNSSESQGQDNRVSPMLQSV